MLPLLSVFLWVGVPLLISLALTPAWAAPIVFLAWWTLLVLCVRRVLRKYDAWERTP